MRLAAAIAVGCIAALAALWLLLPRPTDVAPLERTAPAADDARREAADLGLPAGGAELALPDTRSTTERAGAAPDEPEPEPDTDRPPCTLLVRDEDGAPLAGALVLARADVAARRVAPDRDGVLAASDAGGLATLDRALCATRPRSVFVVHAGHLPAEAALARADGEPHAVTVRRGHEQVFRATTVSGDPAGFRVRMSRTALPPRSDGTEAAAPAWNTLRALYEAEAGPDGVARVQGLAPGTYAIDVEAERGFVPVAIEPSSSRIDVPGEPVSITLAPVVVTALEARGDEIANCWMMSSGSSGNQVNTLTDRLTRIHQREIEARFPRAVVHVSARVTDPVRAPLAKLWLERGGAIDFELTEVPLTEFLAPEVLDCTALEPHPLHEVVLTVYDHERRLVAPSTVTDVFELTTNAVGSFEIDTAHPDERGRFLVPEGTYRIGTSFKPHLTSATSAFTATPEEIVPPASVEVTLTRPLRRCRLEYATPWGEPVDSVSWKIATPLGQVHAAGSDGEPATAILPVGELTFFTDVLGIGTRATQAEVPPGPWDEEVVVRVVPD